MKEKKLMVQVGKDKHDNPICKEVKKLRCQYINKDNVVSVSKKVKPFWNGKSWSFKAFDKLFFIDKDSVFFDTKKQFWVWVLVKPCKDR